MGRGRQAGPPCTAQAHGGPQSSNTPRSPTPHRMKHKDRHRSRGRKRRRGASPPPPPRDLSPDPHAPTPEEISEDTLVIPLEPLWAHCLSTPTIRREVEERTTPWPRKWGSHQWMLYVSGAKRPQQKHIDYIDQSLGRPSGLTTKTQLRRNKILGLVYYQRPARLTKPDPTLPDNGKPSITWEYTGGSRLQRFTRMHKGAELWRVRRVLRFTQPIADSLWLLRGLPKPLSSY